MEGVTRLTTRRAVCNGTVPLFSVLFKMGRLASLHVLSLWGYFRSVNSLTLLACPAHGQKKT